MSDSTHDCLRKLLEELGLGMLWINFEEQRIDSDMISSLSDIEICRLGFDTIGDRHKLREKVKHVKEQANSAPTLAQQSGSVSLAQEIANERAALFSSTSRRSSRLHISGRNKTSASRGWTIQFVCLASKDSLTTPTANEKEILRKAGLGSKKIRLDTDADESSLLHTLMSDEIPNNLQFETVGFPALKNAGGIELLRTTQNCRGLKVIDSNWSTKGLKSVLSPQANIYIRPIQKDFSTKPLQVEEERALVKSLCAGCSSEFYLRELRDHLIVCPGISEDEGEIGQSTTNISSPDEGTALLVDNEVNILTSHHGENGTHEPLLFVEVITTSTPIAENTKVTDASVTTQRDLPPALSVLQNGKIPTFLDTDLLEKLFNTEPSPSACVSQLRLGLDSLGIFQVGKQLPNFVYLFHHSTVPLTLRKVTTLLQPLFSEDGSNANLHEKSIYAAFVRYLREVASGRWNAVILQKVLQFATSTDEEPILGFKLHPAIIFTEVDTSFLPTANTCINLLKIPRPSQNQAQPEDSELFKLYDYSFTNCYYGLA